MTDVASTGGSTTDPQAPPLPDVNTLGDKAHELRAVLVAYIADGMAAQDDTVGHHVDASDLLAEYLTTCAMWREMSRAGVGA